MEQNVKVMQEKAVLVGLNCDLFTKEEAANERTLDELEALLETAGGVCVGKILQNRHEPDPHSFIGEGKAEEVREWVHKAFVSLAYPGKELVTISVDKPSSIIVLLVRLASIFARKLYLL